MRQGTRLRRRPPKTGGADVNLRLGRGARGDDFAGSTAPRVRSREGEQQPGPSNQVAASPVEDPGAGAVVVLFLRGSRLGPYLWAQSRGRTWARRRWTREREALMSIGG